MADLTIPSNYSNQSYNPYFINIYEIKDVTFEPARFKSDISFTLHLMKEGDDNGYIHSVSFYGNLYKNGNIPANISMLLVACGITIVPFDVKKRVIAELLEHDTNKQTVKDLLVGKKIKMLKYVYAKDINTGKPKYKFWNGKLADLKRTTNVFDITTKNDKIIEEFMLKLNSRYPISDYNPTVVEEYNNQQNGGVSETETQIVPNNNNIPF
ncbi:MAG: hypothetical protein HPY57_13015 [Ignavibacteria bacterium]|nr:hypothetical protein [Ignavibacteria bacterium]